MKGNVDNYYPLKVWGLTVLIAPIIFIIIMMDDSNRLLKFSDLIYLLEIVVLIGGIYSFPTLIISYILFVLTKKRLQNLLRIKTIFIALVFIMIIMTNYLFWGRITYHIHGTDESLISTIAYCIAFLIVGILCKIKLESIPLNPLKKSFWLVSNEEITSDIDI